jgi:hypothetical protein
VRIFENLVRLRRAERESGSDDLAAVRDSLEELLGGTVSRNLAAKLLGVSHTALNNWVASGDVRVVISQRGRREVPALLELHEATSGERQKGKRRLHYLEPALAQARSKAGRMRPGRGPEFEDVGRDTHRLAELRSLAYHRALAPRLRRPVVDRAVHKVRRQLREGQIDRDYCEQWLRLLEGPVHELRRAISADDQRGCDLRQNSPLSGLLSEPERRRILEEVS